jgi:hypothetical protein
MFQLLPEPHAVGSYSHEPRFRAWKPEAEGVTNKEFWDFSSAVAERLLDSADRKPHRWPPVVERLPDLPPEQRGDAVDRLSRLADAAEGADEERREVWSAVDKLVRHHRAFADADWALPSEDLDRLAEVARRMEPLDPVEATRWLFDTHLPEIRVQRNGYTGRQEDVDEARADAVTEVLKAGGVEDVLRLARSVRFPGVVGMAAGARLEHKLDAVVLPLVNNADRKSATFASGYSFARAECEGWSWIEMSVKATAGRPLSQARLLQVSDDLPKAWQTATQLGDEVEYQYWQEFSPLGRGSDFPLMHGRVIAALDLLSLYRRKEESLVSSQLILEGLHQLLELPAKHEELQRLSTYEISSCLISCESPLT